MLASLQRNLVLVLANIAFKTQNNLLGSLGLFVEDGFGLTTVTGLFTVVTTLSCDYNKCLTHKSSLVEILFQSSFHTLSKQGCLSGLVLRHLVRGVFLAVLSLAVGVPCLGDVDLFGFDSISSNVLNSLRFSISPLPLVHRFQIPNYQVTITIASFVTLSNSVEVESYEG